MKNELYIISLLAILMILRLNGVGFAAERLNNDQIKSFVDKTMAATNRVKFANDLKLFQTYLYWYHNEESKQEKFDVPGYGLKTRKDIEDQKALVIQTAHSIDPSLAQYLERVNIEDQNADMPLNALWKAINDRINPTQSSTNPVKNFMDQMQYRGGGH